MVRYIFALALLLSGGVFAGPGCDKTRGVAPLKDGKAECLEIGELCHDAGSASGGRAEECHDVGHRGDGADCLAAYEECKELCELAHGAGGEGGGAGAPAQ